MVQNIKETHLWKQKHESEKNTYELKQLQKTRTSYVDNAYELQFINNSKGSTIVL